MIDPALSALAPIIADEAGTPALLPSGTAACLVPISDSPIVHYPEEAAILHTFSAKRRREFLTGRACARAAMAALGRSAQPIGMKADGGPLWPEGVVGSISHTSDYCIAVVAKSERFRSIGVDLEVAMAMSPAVATVALTEAELDSYGANDGVTTLFAIKEAFFKAYHPLVGTLIDFRDVEVDLLRDGRSWCARLVNPSAPAMLGRRTMTGKYRRLSGHVLAIAAIV